MRERERHSRPVKLHVEISMVAPITFILNLIPKDFCITLKGYNDTITVVVLFFLQQERGGDERTSGYKYIHTHDGTHIHTRARTHPQPPCACARTCMHVSNKRKKKG